MVYNHLLGPSSIVKIDRDCSGSGVPVECILAHRHPHVLNPQYVGLETRLELVKLWCQPSVFHLNVRHDVTSLLTYDPWGMNLDPRQHVHSIEAEIAPDYNPRYGGLFQDDIFGVANFARLLQL